MITNAAVTTFVCGPQSCRCTSQGNGDARIVGQRKWVAKQRSEQYGGILFAPESVAAFKEQAETYGVELPEMQEVEVAASQVTVAGKL